MTQDHLDELVLLLVVERAESLRYGHADLPCGHGPTAGFRQAAGQIEAALNPGNLASQQLCHRSRIEEVVSNERLDDASLIHDRRGSSGRIRREDQALPIRNRPCQVDDDRHGCPASCTPSREALESIQDLEVVADLDNPQGTICQAGRCRKPTDPQVLV